MMGDSTRWGNSTCTRRAPSITCALVMMSPSAESSTPEPPLRCLARTVAAGSDPLAAP